MTHGTNRTKLSQVKLPEVCVKPDFAGCATAPKIGALTSKRLTAESVLKTVHSLANRRWSESAETRRRFIAQVHSRTAMPGAFGVNSWNIKMLVTTSWLTSAPARLRVPNGDIYLHQFLPILAHIIPLHLFH